MFDSYIRIYIILVYLFIWSLYWVVFFLCHLLFSLCLWQKYIECWNWQCLWCMCECSFITWQYLLQFKLNSLIPEKMLIMKNKNPKKVQRSQSLIFIIIIIIQCNRAVTQSVKVVIQLNHNFFKILFYFSHFSLQC